MSLQSAKAEAVLPAKDLERARRFYSEKLGLKPKQEESSGATYECGGREFLLFPSTGEPSGTHTQMSFQVDDLEAEIATLKSRGVVFEEYDMPGFKTTNSIYSEENGERAAFFKDSEGNLLAVSEMPRR